jgi:hypothetical protein
MKILDPVAPPPAEVSGMPARRATLEGLTVAVLTNKWVSMDVISDRLSSRLKAEHKVAEVMIEPVPLNGGAPAEVLARVLQRADLAVVGMAN